MNNEQQQPDALTQYIRQQTANTLNHLTAMVVLASAEPVALEESALPMVKKLAQLLAGQCDAHMRERT